MYFNQLCESNYSGSCLCMFVGQLIQYVPMCWYTLIYVVACGSYKKLYYLLIFKLLIKCDGLVVFRAEDVCFSKLFTLAQCNLSIMSPYQLSRLA